MSDRGYPIFVTPLSDEDGGGYLATVPDLKGCMGDGATADEAARDAVSAIAEWLDEAVRLGREVPAPGSAIAQAHQERRQLYETLKKQTAVIERQERLLSEARAEVERVQAAAQSLMEHELEVDECEVRHVWSAVRVAHRGIVMPSHKVRFAN